MRARIPAAMLLMQLVLGAGCASRSDGSSQPPDDFALEVAVLNAAPPEQQADRPAHERSARFVLLPGGDFYSGAGEEATSAGLPPFTRTLSMPELESLFQFVAEQGFTAADDQASVTGDASAVPTGAALTYVVRISASGRRFSFDRSLDDPADGAAPIHALVRSLAALAWLSDDPPHDRAIVPRRYDFGADPYARYRNALQSVDEELDDAGE